MINTLVLIGAACMYTDAYPQEYLAHAHTPLLRSTRRLQLPQSHDTCDRSPENPRRLLASLLSPSGFIGSTVARVFARGLKPAPEQLWFCKSRMMQWPRRGVAENNYRRDKRIYRLCMNRMDGRRFVFLSTDDSKGDSLVPKFAG
jgi:hypothetical protein